MVAGEVVGVAKDIDSIKCRELVLLFSCRVVPLSCGNCTLLFENLILLQFVN